MTTTATPTTDPSATDELVTDVDRQIERASKSRAELDEAFREARKKYAEARQEIDGHIRELRETRRSLTRRGKPRRGGARELDPAVQAGKANLEALHEAARRLGRASQAVLGQESGVKTGNLTHAVRAGVIAGWLRDTGERERGSKVYEYVEPARWPGDRP
jgi:chromosome segregation ATPase